ncbi:glycosyltransferase involved in cell wall biosynthesis [Flavobacterium sp. CG_23.5]|uniref:glycosyltransferase family 2 protein n=1 Tax=Flavobacterium sp. CG_23.5 TaxID=2760708 RepID=UPI001AE4CA93|nr:glycosyltransferase family 2 protein [Flavobacterium sp. CG_23.5]MBP2282554.1 glycosyltransferase involved in cell wall biosynthesis [Flavobacterium sp. CG_23.5]
MNCNLNKKLSVLIITLNEEVHMNALLSDLDFADEIIVVDSFSSDGTESICKSFSKVKFIQHKFEDYSSQRNFAIAQAKNDWILFLDADERLTPALKNEILVMLKNNETYSAFLFYRTFIYENTILRFSGCQNDKIFRLFNKNYATYKTDRLVHEKLEVNGKIGVLKNKLTHYSFSDYESFKSKIISYGKFKAQEKFIKKQKTSYVRHILHPIYNFLYNYIVRLGFLDGRKGMTICYLNAYCIHIRYQELRNLWDKK